MKKRPRQPVQPASTDLVRELNRRTVLNLVRTRQPLSRADLARATGLQRSTISSIVAELIEEEWILEGPSARRERGRRPTFLRMNDGRVIIGVDIRPSQITVALADVNGNFTSQEVIPTPARPQEAIDELVQRIQRLQASSLDKKIEGIGVNIPGRVEPGTAKLIFAPNLNWPPTDLRTPLMEATGLDVELENAANACVLSAAWFERMDVQHLVAVTVSEGIGTAILLNGRLARGKSGMAGEFGHVPLDPQGPLCGCGSHGCWEVFASNRAALRYYDEGQQGIDGLYYPDLLSLAGQGDARAIRALEMQARYLGRGMRMIVAGLDPELILVVGELTRSWDLFGPVIEAEIRSQVLPGAMCPEIKALREGNLARLRGTVAAILQKHFQ